MEFLLLILVVIALVVAFSLRSRMNEAEGRLKQVEAELAALRKLRAAPRAAAPDAATSASPVPDAGSPVASTDKPAEDANDAPALAASVPPVEQSAGSVESPLDAAQSAGAPLPGEPRPVRPRPGAPPPPLRKPRDLESALGTRWTVWVGALALALGGVFLVRYSIEQGYFGPLARVISGLIFAAALLAGGEWLRRRPSETERAAPTGLAERLPSIPALVTGVGTMTAFGSLYSAYALYDLIGPGLCFVLLGALAVGTMVAAALHGPWLAALGLFGAAVNPLLVSSDKPDFWSLAIYLIAVSAASYGLAWLRRWKSIAWATVIVMALWGALMAMALGGTANVAPTWLYLLAQLAMVAAIFAWLPASAVADEAAAPDWPAHGALAIFAGLAALLVLGHEAKGLVFAFLFAALLLGLAFRVPVVAGAALLAGGLATIVLFAWPDLPEPTAGPQSAVLAAPLPDQVMNFNLTGLAFATLVAGTGILRLMRSAALPRLTGGLYALAATLTPIALLIVAWWRIHGFASAPEFAAIAAALAAGMTVMALRFRKSLASLVEAIGLEAFAAGAMAALALGLTMALERGGLTVAFALASCGAAYITSRGPINSLRLAAGILGLVVLVRVAIDPAINAGNPGTTPILNWLLFGYGVPAVAFFAAARFLGPGEDRWLEQLMQGLALLFLALLFVFQIRHLIHDGAVLTERASHLEIGLHLAVMAGFASVLMRVDPVDANPVYRIASIAFALITLPLGLIGLMLAENPLERGNPVEGGLFLNSLLLGYALPAASLLALYLLARHRRPWWYARPVGILGLVIGFAYVSLQTRRFFHEADISIGANTTGEGELWAYSAVWLAIGVALLAAGIVRGSQLMRLISAAFIVPTVFKVFLIDMAGLQGAWRALSFIGLGLALIGIGLVYQRFVFVRRPVPPEDDPAESPPG